MKRIDLAAASAAVCWLLASATATGEVLSPRQQQNDRVLNEVWQSVAESHFRKDLATVGKKKIFDKYRPQILQSADDAALVRNMNQMLLEIGTSHLQIFAPVEKPRQAVLQALQQPGTQSPADPGFTILDAAGRLLVWEVRKGSAAALCDIRPGDELLAVDGMEIGRKPDAMSPWSMLARAYLERGAAGSVCSIRMKNASDGRVREFKLKRSASGGTFFQAINLPPLVLRYKAWMLTEKTGCVRFNFFMPEVVRQFRKDLRHGQLKKMRNLVIDLRGNPGGILLTAEWLGAWSLAKPALLGTLIVDGVRLTPNIEPQKLGFHGPVAVLIDRDSMSTSELFAAAVQDAKAGTVIGEKTPGKCLPSLLLTLRCGYRLQAVTGQALRPSGKSIEKTGVTPDLTAVNAFPGGKDAVLETAVKFLER